MFSNRQKKLKFNSMIKELWDRCLERLKEEFPAQQFNTWIRPLQVEVGENILRLLAPNQFVYEWINERYLSRINELILDRYRSLKTKASVPTGARSQTMHP